MTLSTSFRSLIHRRHEVADPAPVPAFLRDCRDGIAPAELSVPAALLADAAAAQWCRGHRVSVEAGSLAESHAAMAAGIPPRLLTVDTRDLDDADLAAVAGLGVGRVVVDDVGPVARLADCAGRTVDVVVQLGDSDAVDAAVDAVLARPNLRLIGVRHRGDPAAAVGSMIELLDHIRRRHGCLLTRIYLDGAAIGYPQTTPAGWRAVGGVVDQAATDACVALRFPRPVVVIGLNAAMTNTRPRP